MFKALNFYTIFILFLVGFGNNCLAQKEFDNSNFQDPCPDSLGNIARRHTESLSVVMPASLVAPGAASLHFDALKKLNMSTRDEILKYQGWLISIDNLHSMRLQ